jgi:hypothetical protein
VTLAGGSLILHEDNNAAADPPPENPGTAITLEQADARYAAILRTAAQGNPNIQTLTVTGSLTDGDVSVTIPTLYRVGVSGGKPEYIDTLSQPLDAVRLFWQTQEGGKWVLSYSDGTVSATWTSTANVATPDLVPAGAWHADTNSTAWKPSDPADGTPTVTDTGIALQGSQIGQLLRLETADPDDGVHRWFAWDGTAWDEIAPTLAATLTLLGLPTYADLAAANAALDVGDLYYDLSASKLKIATA